MNRQNQQPEKQKEKSRFSQEQYDFLIECSEKGDEGIKEWNKRRKEQKEPCDGYIFLEGAQLARLASPDEINSSDVNKYEIKTYLTGTSLVIRRCYLRGINLAEAYLNNASLVGVDLKNADLTKAHLEGADLEGAIILGTKFQRAKVDGTTSLWECKINRYSRKDKFTDFSGVALDDISIDTGTKQLLEYNVRRNNWEQWYKEHHIQQWLVRLFWSFSDYGQSTWRILAWFFRLAVVFAAIYLLFAYISPPGIISHLSVIKDTQQTVPGWLLPLRTFYFSVVTMTTLGFGDMYAKDQSIWGHILLIIQVILGYVLLGALVTRFAVLFAAGGPAGKFADEKKELYRK